MRTLAVTRTPLRVSLLGGGTDLPEFSDFHTGAVLSMAIDKFIYVTVKRHSPFFGEAYRLQYSNTEICSARHEIKNNIIRSTLEYLSIDEPLIISTISDVPAGSGLGSSSSFCVGLLNGLNFLCNLRIPKSNIAEIAFEIERSISPCIGRQDAYAATFGGFNLFKFFKNDNSISPVPFTRKLYPTLSSFRLYWTEISRSANQILSSQSRSVGDKLDLYLRLSSLAQDGYISLLEGDGDLHSVFSTFLGRNRDLKYQLDDSIINDRIIAIERRILDAGAVSTKLLGAGGGGFILSVFPDCESALKADSILDLKSLDFSIDTLGTDLIHQSRP